MAVSERRGAVLSDAVGLTADYLVGAHGGASAAWHAVSEHPHRRAGGEFDVALLGELERRCFEPVAPRFRLGRQAA